MLHKEHLFFPTQIYKPATMKRQETYAEELDTDTRTAQGHQWHHHFLSTWGDFRIFSNHTWTSNPENKYLSRRASRAPRRKLSTNHTPGCSNIFNTSSSRQFYKPDLSQLGKLCYRLQICHLNTVSTIEWLYQIRFHRQEKLNRWLQKNHCWTRSTAPLVVGSTAASKPTPKQSAEYSLSTDNGIQVLTQISRKKDQNFTPDV